MSGMTVMQVLPALDSGGVERGTVQVACGLVERGYRAVVVSAPGRLVAELEAGGAEHVNLPVGRKRPATLALVRPLAELIERDRPDIVHVRSRLPAWIARGALARAARRGLHPHLVTTAHGPYSPGRYSAVMTRGERIIAVSAFIADYLDSTFPKLDRSRIRVIPRGVDPSEFHPGFVTETHWRREFLDAFPGISGRRLLTLPGRLTRWKGQTGFLEMLASLAREREDWHALIVGGAHPRKRAFADELARRITELGLEGRVTLTGDRPDLKQILAVSDVAFSLTLDPEAFGRTTLEAIALGTPVVGFAHGGTREILEALYPEGLVPVGDLDAAARRTAAILDRPTRLAAGAGPFTEAAMVAATLDVYRELIDGGGHR